LRLKTLDQALSDQITLAAQPSPNRSDMSYLQYWLQHPKGGANALRGPGSMTWSPVEDGGHRIDDFVDVSSLRNAERTVTQWVLDVLWPIIQHLPKRLMPVRGCDKGFTICYGDRER
jgi:hypothetical protein